MSFSHQIDIQVRGVGLVISLTALINDKG